MQGIPDRGRRTKQYENNNSILIPPALSQFIGDLGHPDAESPSKKTVSVQGIPDQVRDEEFFISFCGVL